MFHINMYLVMEVLEIFLMYPEPEMECVGEHLSTACVLYLPVQSRSIARTHAVMSSVSPEVHRGAGTDGWQ